LYKAFKKILLLAILITIAPSFSFAEQVKYQQTSDAGFYYELTIESESPEVMKPLPVRLNVSTPEGSPVTGAQVNCSLTMPAMAMPNNMPPIKESEQTGQYKGIFLLTMGGLWHVELTMSYGDGKQDTVVIPIPGVTSDGKESDVDSKLESLFHEEKSSSK
jgi:hypothetical protein